MDPGAGTYVAGAGRLADEGSGELAWQAERAGRGGKRRDVAVRAAQSGAHRVDGDWPGPAAC